MHHTILYFVDPHLPAAGSCQLSKIGRSSFFPLQMRSDTLSAPRYSEFERRIIFVMLDYNMIKDNLDINGSWFTLQCV